MDRINQGDILDGITFISNQREVHFGGRGGTFFKDNMFLTEQQQEQFSSMKIVAFTGAVFDVLQRVGYYAVPIGWDIVKDYVMLRWLVDQGRAIPHVISGEGKTGDDDNDGSSSLTKGLELLMNLPDGPFRRVLTFLI